MPQLIQLICLWIFRKYYKRHLCENDVIILTCPTNKTFTRRHWTHWFTLSNVHFIYPRAPAGTNILYFHLAYLVAMPAGILSCLHIMLCTIDTIILGQYLNCMLLDIIPFSIAPELLIAQRQPFLWAEWSLNLLSYFCQLGIKFQSVNTYLTRNWYPNREAILVRHYFFFPNCVIASWLRSKSVICAFSEKI